MPGRTAILALLAAIPILAGEALSCLRRAASAPAPQVLVLLQRSPTAYRVFVPGYLGVPYATPQAYCACAISFPANAPITGVGSALVLDAATGEPLPTGGEVFRFRVASSIGQDFANAAGGTWTGFFATVTRPVPAGQSLWLAFDFDVQANTSPAALDAALRGARIGIDDATASRAIVKGPHHHVLTSAGAAPSCPLYYKLDRNTGDFAVNYGNGGAPETGALHTGNNAGPWSDRRLFGAGALRGSSNASASEYNYCDTGWRTGFAGSFTVSWWMRERVPAGSQPSYLWGGLNGFRCFTGGVAGATLWVRSWDNSSFNIQMPTVGADLQARARAPAGLSVALVVDGTLRTAQWYVDGQRHGAAIALPGPAFVPESPNGFAIGRHASDTSTSVYDIDEVIFCNGAAPDPVIRQWAAAPVAAGGSFGRSCGLALGTTGGEPKVGNGLYAHTVEGPPNLRFLLVVGVRPNAGFDMGVAFPALAGCRWYASFDLQLIGASASGSTRLPGGIPNSPGLAGSFVELQVLGFSGATPVQSNATSHRIELN